MIDGTNANLAYLTPESFVSLPVNLAISKCRGKHLPSLITIVSLHDLCMILFQEVFCSPTRNLLRMLQPKGNSEEDQAAKQWADNLTPLRRTSVTKAPSGAVKAALAEITLAEKVFVAPRCLLWVSPTRQARVLRAF
jgi:hypothetical protein